MSARQLDSDSFEDSQQRRTQPRASSGAPRTLEDLMALPDNFDSDTDAGALDGPHGAEFERVRGADSDSVEVGVAVGGNNGGMEEVKVRRFDADGMSYETDFSADDGGAALVLPPMSAERYRFIQMPEPLPPAGNRTANGLVDGKKELEDVIDMLDHSDPMLRITQSKIRGFRDYLHVVEREEVALLHDFTTDVGRTAALGINPAAVRIQEEQRVRFEARLAALRDRRAHWRGMEFDALEERANIIRSHLQLHGVHYRAHQKLNFWRDKSGLDLWMVGFFALTVLVNVGYIVFLTFPFKPAPLVRVLPDATRPIEFSYRITVLVSLFVVVGLSFWMASYKRFQWAALSINLLLVGWSVEWGLLMHVFFEWAFVTGFLQIEVTPRLITLTLYTATAVLVSHAVLLGRVDARQAMVMATLECVPFAVITGFQRFYLVVDNGGAVSVFTYGAVFGLVASWVYALLGGHHKPRKPGHGRQPGKKYNEELKVTLLRFVVTTAHPPCSSFAQSNAHPRRHSYRSSGFAWLGVLVLWTLWPMYNSALAPIAGATQGRAVATTVVALMASGCTAIALSYLLHGAMHMRSFVHATLAGGVAMGCAHSALVPPYIAGLLGVASGAVAALGEWQLAEWLENGLKLYDTQGVLFTLLVPATLGWVVACIVCAAAVGTTVWGVPFAVMFPSPNQAGYLAASWIIALVLGATVGALAGWLLSLMRPKPQYFTEHEMFATGPEYAAF